jgi:hypothetical protein
MSYQDLRYRVDVNVATIALKGPERRNALSRNLEIHRAFDEVPGLQASGVRSALLLQGVLSALVHSSHNEDRERLFEAQRRRGLKAYLQIRDGPFQPEPMGPRSKPRQPTE